MLRAFVAPSLRSFAASPSFLPSLTPSILYSFLPPLFPILCGLWTDETTEGKREGRKTGVRYVVRVTSPPQWKRKEGEEERRTARRTRTEDIHDGRTTREREAKLQRRPPSIYSLTHSLTRVSIHPNDRPIVGLPPPPLLSFPPFLRSSIPFSLFATQTKPVCSAPLFSAVRLQWESEAEEEEEDDSDGATPAAARPSFLPSIARADGRTDGRMADGLSSIFLSPPLLSSPLLFPLSYLDSVNGATACGSCLSERQPLVS